jgi:hypothetical protein
VAITRSDRPTFPQPGAPPGTGAPGPGRPSERHLRSLGRFLAVGLAGLAMLVTGLIWDAVVHVVAARVRAGHGLAVVWVRLVQPAAWMVASIARMSW